MVNVEVNRLCCTAAKRPMADKKEAAKKAHATTAKNQKEGPNRKGANQEQDVGQEERGSKWQIEKVI